MKISREQTSIVFYFFHAVVIYNDHFGSRRIANDFFQSKPEVFGNSLLVNVLPLPDHYVFTDFLTAVLGIHFKAETAWFNEDKVELWNVCDQIAFSFQIAQFSNFICKLNVIKKGSFTAFIDNGEKPLNPGAFRITWSNVSLYA